MEHALKINPRRPGEGLADYCYRVIYYNILHLRLPPNAIINEAEIAAALGVSRTPVHEAVAHLKEDTLIEILPRKESRVSRINLPHVCEGVFTRTTLEPSVVRQIIGKVSGEILDQMKKSLEMQKAIQERGINTSEFYFYDRQFHELLFKAAGKEHVHELSRMVNLHSLRVSYLIDFDQSNFVAVESSSYREHEILFDLITEKIPLDFDLNEFMYKHIARFQNFFEPYVEKYPDFFSFTEDD